MNAPEPGGYHLRVDPIPGRVRALRDGHLIAETTGARVMHETRLPPTIYVPEADVTGLSRPGEQRTFCPFKGTAVYRDLAVAGETLRNAVWSYPRPLFEGLAVEGLVGFSPGVVGTWETEAGLPQAGPDAPLSGPLVDWLMREAWLARDPAELTLRLAHAMRAAGICVSRLNVTLASLHPLLAGIVFIWSRASDEVTVMETSHERLSEPEFHNSPLRHVMAGLGGVRQPLTVRDAEFTFPIMDDLRAEGATDYVAMPLPFTGGRINALTMACDHPDGFTTANLGLVFECSSVIARHFEVHTQRMDARSLLGTFLGKRTGERVLGGEIRRGDGEEIEAAVLFCDLRGSSRLAGSMERSAYLDLLNRFFETATAAIEAEEGEVLKFIGDAVLAVFPTEAGARDASARAARSSRAICRTLEAIEEPGGQPLGAAIGIAFGPVTYGNVGSRDRLDFTVIGEAANIAARLADLSKRVGEPVLIEAAADPGGSRPLGRHKLRNIAAPVDVFAPV